MSSKPKESQNSQLSSNLTKKNLIPLEHHQHSLILKQLAMMPTKIILVKDIRTNWR
jgi:hypothetical protein